MSRAEFLVQRKLNSNPYTTLHRYPTTGWSESTDLLTEVQRYWTSFPDKKPYACVLGLSGSGEISLLVYRNGSYGTAIANHYAWSESVVLRNSNGTWSKYDVQAEINAINDKIGITTVAATEGALPLYVSKSNSILYLRMLYSAPNTAITAGQWTLFGKVPEAYRPSAISYFGGVFTSALGEVFGFRGSVNTSGEIAGMFEKNVPLSVNLFGTVVVII